MHRGGCSHRIGLVYNLKVSHPRQPVTRRSRITYQLDNMVQLLSVDFEDSGSMRNTSCRALVDSETVLNDPEKVIEDRFEDCMMLRQGTAGGRVDYYRSPCATEVAKGVKAPVLDSLVVGDAA